MLEFLKRLLCKPIATGALKDDRTDIQKAGAYDSRELVSAFPLEWKEKAIWKSYPVKQQFYTSSCVAQSTTKHLAINNIKDFGKYIDLSGEFFYYFRANKPSGGMGLLDTTNIATKIGSCKNEKIKQRIHESEPETIPTDEMKKEALDFKGKYHIEDKERTMESIARIIETQGSCVVWFWFDWDGREWWNWNPSIIYPNLEKYSNNATRHSVVATDYGLKGGKKVLVINDSAGNNSAFDNQIRFIDENFLSRCYVSYYIVDLENAQDIDKPQWTGIRRLALGDRGDDVKQLQNILKYEKLFLDIEPTGYYGGITRQAVIKLQEKYKTQILVPAGLTKGTGLVGTYTLSWLKENYGI